MTIRFRNRAALFCLIAAAALSAGCSSKGSKADRPDNPFRADSAKPGDPRAPLSERELRLEADQAYRRSHESLLSADYDVAITRFTQLISRYPFSDYATQAELEKIFAQYRSFQADEAGLAADRFLREHPRHPNADYVQYIKGLTDSNRDKGLVDYLPLDASKRDATNSRRAYDDFALLIQRFPNSRYASDARKRMIYLRNRVASHELSVTRYYIKRGAWVAAAKRGESIIAEYPGAPATAEVLLLLRTCYERLGEKAQLAEVDQLIAANSASLQAAKASAPTPAAPAVTPNAVATNSPLPVAAAAPAPTGFFGRAAGWLDTLNKTYTIPTTAPAAGATAGGSDARSEPQYAAPGSLTTGPYSGPDSSYTIPRAVDNRAPVEAEGNAQPLPAPTLAPAPAQAAAPGTPATPTSSSITTATPQTVTSPAAVVAVPAPAPSAATAATTQPPKEKSGGFLDFLNKTYTIGGPAKAKPEAAPPATAPTQTGNAPVASAPTTATATTGSGSSGVHVSIDYDEEESRKKADAEAAKGIAGIPGAPGPAPAPPAPALPEAPAK